MISRSVAIILVMTSFLYGASAVQASSVLDQSSFRITIGDCIATVSLVSDIDPITFEESGIEVHLLWTRTVGTNEVLRATEVIPCTFDAHSVGHGGQGRLLLGGKSSLSGSNNTIIEVWDITKPLTETSQTSGDFILSPQGVNGVNRIQDNDVDRKRTVRWFGRFKDTDSKFLACYAANDIWEYSITGSTERLAGSVDGQSGSTVVSEVGQYRVINSRDHLNLGRYILLSSFYSANSYFLVLDADRDGEMDDALAITDSDIDALHLFDPALLLPFEVGVPFCMPADINSTGLPALLTGTMGAVEGSGLHLETTQGVPAHLGYFLVGTSLSEPGVQISEGHLCLALGGVDQFGRYNVIGGAANSIGVFDASGVFQNLSSTSSTGTGYDIPRWIPTIGGAVVNGETWHFQLWYRSNSNGASNFSNGLSVTF
jgi:hypothetical protein